MMLGRREFLVSSALLASGVAGAADGGGKLRVGVLGLGHAHALDVVKVLRASADYELAGVWEPDQAVWGEVCGSPALEGVRRLDVKDLLGEVEVVAVESAVPRLVEDAQLAAEAGKHIHLDKPAGFSLKAFRRLLDTMEKKGLLLQMGYMFRYNAGFDFARQAIRDGLLGDVYRIHACMDTDYNQAKRLRYEDTPGGMMFELACHLLDMTMLMLGTPKKVTPFLRHDARDDDALLDNTAAVFEFDGAMAILQSAAMLPNAFASRRFEVCGTNGSILIEPLEPPVVKLNLRDASGGFKKGIQKIEVPNHERHVRDFEDFARCVRGEAEFAYTKAHDYEVQRALDRLRA